MLALYESCRARNAHWTLSLREVLLKESVLESLQLIGRDLAHLIAHEVDFILRNVDHFTNYRIEKAGLSTAYLADDDHELSFFDLQVDVLDAQNMVKTTWWERNVKNLASLRLHLAYPFAKPGLGLFEPLLLLLFSLLLQLFFLFIVQHTDAPTEATLYSESVFRLVILGRRSLINETLLNFGRKVEAIQPNHRILQMEELAIQMVDVVDTALDLPHHNVGHRHRAQVENVAVVYVETIDEEWHELVQESVPEVVELISVERAIIQFHLFLVEAFDFVKEFVFPAIELDSLNVLEGLIDVGHAFVVLLAPLLVNIAFGFTSEVAHQELAESEQDNDEAVPTDVLESEVGGHD